MVRRLAFGLGFVLGLFAVSIYGMDRGCSYSVFYGKTDLFLKEMLDEKHVFPARPFEAHGNVVGDAWQVHNCG